MEQSGFRPSKKCTICRQWHGEVLSEREGVFVIRCQSCNLYYVDFQPPTEQQIISRGEQESAAGIEYLDQVYESKYQAWQDYYSRWLLKLQEYSPEKRLLDIGCGAGLLVRAACDQGWDAYGQDLSTDTIDYGRSRLGLNGRLFDLPLDSLNFLGRFDIVTLFSVIEHVEDPFIFLNQVRELLRPGGIIMIKTPSQASLITKMHWGLNRLSRGKMDFDLYNQEHVYRFSPQTLKLLLEKVGFRIRAQGFDDHLWVTATRYLQYHNHKMIRYAFLAGVFSMGKLMKMENQLYMLASLEN